MDPEQMVNEHIASGAGVTVAAIRQPLSLADQFGVIEVGEDRKRIQAFREKPTDAHGLPDAPDQVYASMGNYMFTTAALREYIERDARDLTSKHDMGGNIIPMMVEDGDANVYDFRDNIVPGSTDRDRGYWRDVGTLDSFYDAHMDLISIHPVFNLYNYDWPIYTENRPWPPAKFVHGAQERLGRAIGSMVSNGAVVSGALVENSILSPNVRVHSWAHVEGSVLFEGVDVGQHAVVRNAIIDKGVRIPERAEIGVDVERDRARYTVSDNGIAVIGKGQTVEG
jgi:glucose-1-phosphate adenylyltransferase